MTAFYGFGLALNDMYIGKYPLPEIFTIIFIIYVLLTRKKLGKVHSLLFIGILFIIGSFFSYKSRGYFLQSSYINNLIRLIFYALGTTIVPYYFVKYQKFPEIFRGISLIIKICFILGVIEFIGKNVFDIYVSWQIPGLSKGYGSISAGNRTRSIFAEPAHFGIIIGSCTVFYLRYFSNKKKPKDYYHVIIAAILSLFIALSLGSYTFLVVILYLVYLDLKNSGYISSRNKTIIAIIASFMFIVSVSILLASGLLEELILGRISRISAGEDVSAEHRLLGQFELVTTGLRLYPINGIGLGQSLAFLENSNLKFETLFFMKGYSTSSGVNNTLVYVFLQTGYVGIVIFMSYFISRLSFDRYILLTFFLMCFAWGYFNGPFFWFFIYMSKALFLERKLSTVS